MGVLKDLAKSLIRAWLYALLSWFVTKGWIQQSDADSWLDPMTATVLGGVGFVAVYLWSARDKIKSWVFGKLALRARANTPPEVIKEEIKQISLVEEVKTAMETTAPSPDAGDGALKGE
jgi:hypothetical protein